MLSIISNKYKGAKRLSYVISTQCLLSECLRQLDNITIGSWMIMVDESETRYREYSSTIREMRDQIQRDADLLWEEQNQLIKEIDGGYKGNGS